MFYNKNLESYFGRHFGARVDFAAIDALKSAVDSAIDLVMRDGNIIEQGTHDELIKKGGFYKELYESQFPHT